MTAEMNRILAQRAGLAVRGRSLAVIFSFAVHAGVLVWLFFPNLGTASTREVYVSPGFVQLKIVDAGELAAPEPEVTAAPEPAPVVEKPGPRVVETIPPPETRKEPPKKKEAPPPKPPEPARTRRPSEPRRSGRSAGTAGKSLGIGGAGMLDGLDVKDFRYSWYLDLLVTRISSAWQEPVLDSRFGDQYRVTVYFRIHRDGSVSDIRIEEPSGIDMLDISAVRAVGEAAPLPPLPQEYRGDRLGVHFWFEYEKNR